MADYDWNIVYTPLEAAADVARKLKELEDRVRKLEEELKGEYVEFTGNSKNWQLEVSQRLSELDAFANGIIDVIKELRPYLEDSGS